MSFEFIGNRDQKSRADNNVIAFEYDEEKDSELAEILTRVDLPLMESIFRERIGHSEGASEQINFKKVDQIFSGRPKAKKTFDPREGLGFYNAWDDDIVVSFDNIKYKFGEENAELALIHILSHEQGHATAKHTFLDNDLQGATEDSPQRACVLGYAELEVYETDAQGNIGDHLAKHALFDEAVTEKLARQVFDEYIARSGQYDDEAVESFKKRREEVLGEYGHEAYVEVLDIIISEISKNTGISEDVIWKDIQRGRQEGLEFDDEIRALIVKTFSEEFYEALRNSHVAKIAEYIDSPKLKEFIKK
ncbi:hypothetical protein C0580_02985 [Candidatus Parcubacteria bacterium]|nr:MAG: hypothetical protein C0580_02985 [Candidatus Parcubacteria bacterium]